MNLVFMLDRQNARSWPGRIWKRDLASVTTPTISNKGVISLVGLGLRLEFVV